MPEPDASGACASCSRQTSRRAARSGTQPPTLDPLELRVSSGIRGIWTITVATCRPSHLASPSPNGSFDSGRRILNDSEFADPASASAPSTTRRRRCSAVTCFSRSATSFSGFGGRTRNADLRRAAGSGRAPGPDWGWAYQTLDGHLERGQMDYQLWKCSTLVRSSTGSMPSQKWQSSETHFSTWGFAWSDGASRSNCSAMR